MGLDVENRVKGMRVALLLLDNAELKGKMTESLKKIESFLGLKKFFHENMFAKMNPEDRFYCKDITFIKQAIKSFMRNVTMKPIPSRVHSEIKCTSDKPSKSRSSTFETSQEETAALEQLYRLYASTKSKLESRLNRTFQWG